MATEFLATLTTPATPVVAPEPAKPADAPAAAPAKPAEPAKPVEAPKPVAKAPEKPAEPAKQPAPINIDDPKVPAAELRKHMKEQKGRYETTIQERERALAETSAKLKVLEGKRFWSEQDEVKFKELETKQAYLESQHYSRNYADSPEYKAKYFIPLNEKFAEAVEISKSLDVKYADGAEEKIRKGDEADIRRIYNAPNNAERRKMARELFGDYAQDVLDAVFPMAALAKEAAQVVKDKAENYTVEQQKQQELSKTSATQFQQLIVAAADQLAKAQPEIFGVPENNPEEADLLKKGMGFVDESSANMSKFKPEERAARVSLIRSMAGAYPRMAHILSKTRSELEAANAELAKYRGSDPGNAGDAGGAGAPAPSGDGGTDDMAKEFAEYDK